MCLSKTKRILTVQLLLFFSAFLWPLEIQQRGIIAKEKIQLIEVMKLGGVEEAVLFQWVGVCADEEENIYVSDSLDYSIKKFDSSGKLLKKSGRRGQGPGEFLAPRLLDVSDSYIWVTDQLIPGIHVFDKGLDFVGRIPIKEPITDMKVFGDDEVAVAPLSMKLPSRICFYDFEGNLTKEIGLKETLPGKILDQVSFDFDDQKNLYVAYNFQDRIEKFDAGGRMIWSRTLLKTGRIKEKKISGYVLPAELVYKDVDLDREGNVYILVGGLSENPSRDIYVLDPDGNRLARLTLPETTHCIYIDDRNFLFSREKAGICIKKYAIRFLAGYNPFFGHRDF